MFANFEMLGLGVMAPDKRLPSAFLSKSKIHCEYLWAQRYKPWMEVSLVPSYCLGSMGLISICMPILKCSEHRVIAPERSFGSNLTFVFFLSKICISMSKTKICKRCTTFLTKNHCFYLNYSGKKLKFIFWWIC